MPGRARHTPRQRTRRRADRRLGIWVSATDYRAAMEKSSVFLKIVLLSTELSMAPMQQTAACDALHSAERRMCRWIVQVRDRVGDDVLRLTHDFVAQMLAVRRPTVTLIAQELQNAGLIRCRRGEITILDHARLGHAACELRRGAAPEARHVIADFRVFPTGIGTVPLPPPRLGGGENKLILRRSETPRPASSGWVRPPRGLLEAQLGGTGHMALSSSACSSTTRRRAPASNMAICRKSSSRIASSAEERAPSPSTTPTLRTCGGDGQSRHQRRPSSCHIHAG